MEYKILESNGIDIENVDGAAFNNFSAGGKNGVLKGVLSECNLTSSGSTLFIQPGELLIQGFRVKILSPHNFSLGSSASLLTQVLTARISLSKNRSVSFNLFVSSQGPVYKDDLFSEEEGVYDIELARIVTDQNGIVSVKKTVETLSGYSGTGSSNGETGSVVSPILLSLTRHDGLIQNTGAILKLFEYAYVTIPVKGGQQLLIQSGNTNAVFSCHTSVSEGSAPYSQGSGWTTKVVLGANISREYTLPEDAKYLVFYTLYANIESSPVSLSIDGFDFCKNVADNVSQKFSKSDVVQEPGANPKKVMSQEATTRCVDEKIVQGILLPTLSVLQKRVGVIQSTGVWYTAGGDQHILIPVKGGQNLAVKQASFACLKDYVEPVNTASALLSDDANFNKRIDVYTQRREYTLPSDAKYIAVFVKVSGEDRYPESFTLDGYDFLTGVNDKLTSVITEVDRNAADIKDLKDSRYIGFYDLLIAGSDFVSKAETVDNYYVNGRGEVLSNLGSSCLKYTDPIPGKTLFYAIESESLLTGGTIGAVGLYNGSELLSYVRDYVYGDGYSYLSFVVPEACDTIYFPQKLNNTVNYTGKCHVSYLSLPDENGEIVEIAGYPVQDSEARALIDQIKETNTETDYRGLVWLAVGDSLTEKNFRAALNYHDYIAQRTGITVLNEGKSGTGYMNDYGSDKPFYERVLNYADTHFDIVTLFGSGNDNSKPLGTVDDTGTETVGGCVNTTIDNLFSVNPFAHIGIITPTPWNNYTPNIAGNRMMQYSALLVEIARKRGIPVLDLYWSCGLHPERADFRNEFYSSDGIGSSGQVDGIHPNSKGQKWIASHILQFIKTLLF